MANEITFGYQTGDTLTYGVYQPDGTVRTAAGTALPEVAGTGYYKATDASVTAGDIVIVKDTTKVIGYGEYQPDIDTASIIAEIDANEAKLDTAIGDIAAVKGDTAAILIDTDTMEADLKTYIDDEIVGADGDTLETLSDQLDSTDSEVAKEHNVYGPGE